MKTKNIGLKDTVKTLLRKKEAIAFLGLVVIVLTFTIASPQFFTPYNMMSIFRQTSINAILAVGMTFVIISGGIDLSVSATVSLSGTLAAISMAQWGFGTVGGILVGLLTGVVIGFINGVVIAKLDVPPIITTLGTQTAANGIALVITGGYSVTGLAEGFSVIGRGNLGPVPVPAIIMIAMYVIGYIMLNKRRFGTYTYGVGGNADATRLAGVSVDKTKIMVYVYSGVMAAVVGLILASRLNSGQPSAGAGLELNAIAAVVIGGVSVMGGAGNMIGGLFGALIMCVLTNGFDILGLGRFYQMICTGVILVGAVAAQKRNRSI